MAPKTKKKPDVDANHPFAMPANHSDDTPVELDADAKAASLKVILDAMGALSWVRDAVNKGTLTKSTRFNGLGVANSNLAHLGELLGKNEDDAQSAQLRKSQLRIANDEIGRLREVMAKGVTVEAMGNKLDQLSKTVHYWWKSLGFLTAKGSFEPNWKGADYHAVLSSYLDRHGSLLMEDKPVTAKELKLKTIEELSKVADVSQDDGDPHFLDTPRNRRYIIDALMVRFPNSRVWSFQSHVCRSGEFQIREVEVYIPIQSIEE